MTVPVGAARSTAASWLARRTASERRTLAVAAIVSVVALLLSRGVLPAASRWAAREAVLDSKLERLARLRALARDEGALRQAVATRTARLAARPQQPLAARTAPLAAAALQALVQGYAAQSQVRVSRVEVAADSAAASSGDAPLPAVAATVVGTGDVYGLAALLALLQHGPRLLEVSELQAQAIPGPRGEELLQLSIVVRAPYAAEPE